MVRNRASTFGRSRHRVGRNDRQGISLLEIMISIGIVGIGLIGVAAMIPLAHFKAAQGVQQDRKALFGKRAFREFRVRGMDDLGNLVSPASLMGSSDQWSGGPFCLDPVMLAHALSGPNPNDTNYHRFPYGNGTPIVASRVTMVREKDALSQPGFAANPMAALMSRTQAENLFLLHDDLDVVQPDDATLPARIQYLDTDRMVSGGGYSWLATFVPQSHFIPQPVPQPLVNSGLYAISLAVLHRRNLEAYPPEELTAQVLEANLSGPIKDVLLSPTVPPVGEFGLNTLSEKDWILLVERDPNSTLIRDMKWYRVMMVQDDDQNNTIRSVSLDGPDWGTTTMGQNTFVAARQGNLYAVYLRGVVAVYEKTVRLHRSSVYAQ